MVKLYLWVLQKLLWDLGSYPEAVAGPQAFRSILMVAFMMGGLPRA